MQAPKATPARASRQRHYRRCDYPVQKLYFRKNQPTTKVTRPCLDLIKGRGLHKRCKRHSPSARAEIRKAGNSDYQKKWRGDHKDLVLFCKRAREWSDKVAQYLTNQHVNLLHLEWLSRDSSKKRAYTRLSPSFLHRHFSRQLRRSLYAFANLGNRQNIPLLFPDGRYVYALCEVDNVENVTYGIKYAIIVSSKQLPIQKPDIGIFQSWYSKWGHIQDDFIYFFLKYPTGFDIRIDLIFSLSPEPIILQDIPTIFVNSEHGDGGCMGWMVDCQGDDRRLQRSLQDLRGSIRDLRRLLGFGDKTQNQKNFIDYSFSTIRCPLWGERPCGCQIMHEGVPIEIAWPIWPGFPVTREMIEAMTIYERRVE